MMRTMFSTVLQSLLLVIGLLLGSLSGANTTDSSKKEEQPGFEKREISYLMKRLRHRIKKREFDWDLSLFHNRDWKSHGYSVKGMPLIYWTCGDPKSMNRSLILSSVHGDEVTPTFFGFRLVEWLKANRETVCKDKFIVVAPIVNPDGFLRYRRGTRTNYNKVDLNRNFLTPDWKTDAHRRWKKTARGGQPQRRYYPGDKPASEPEIHFQTWLIDEFHPNKIMSVHAPLRFFEFDGPNIEKLKIFATHYIAAVEAMKKELKNVTKMLRFQVYGTFPGSLGNYAGRLKGIPTITTELPSSSPRKAAKYFGELEKSTRVFLKYDFSKENARHLTQGY